MTCDLQSLNWELSDLKPPVPRDRLIFEEVLVRGRGQQEVAEEHGISQPRVSKILAEVGIWLCRVLPEAIAKEQVEGQMAMAFWLAQARLDFLYHKALEAFVASSKDKVIAKQGKRGEVAWEEKATIPQNPVVGLMSGAIRAATLAARMCCEAAKSSDKALAKQQEQQGMSPANPVMSQTEKTAEWPPAASPETQAEPVVAAEELSAHESHELVIKSIIKVLRNDPKRADWTESEFRQNAEITLAKLNADVLEEEARRKLQAEAKAAKAARAAARAAKKAVPTAVPPTPEPAAPIIKAEQPLTNFRQYEPPSLSLNAARLENLRRERDKRRSPEQRRREFLAPLAAG